MPVTLAQARLNAPDKLHAAVIDEFRKNSFLLDRITFDDAATPVGGGSTLAYSYNRIKTQPTAQTRAINTEYEPQEATEEQFNVVLKVLGGAFSMDRVIANMGGIKGQLQLQLEQKIKAATALFGDLVINGDSAVDTNAFDGLDKALAGSVTDTSASSIDLSTAAALDSNYKAFVDMLDEFVSQLDGTPSALMCNTKLYNKIKAVARRMGMYQETKNDFGRQISMYGDTPIVDLGAKAGTNDPVIATDSTAKTTSLYAVRFGLDGFHAVSPTGSNVIQAYMPDFNTPGAVKKGEVELVTTVALKATKAAAVLRDIKVASA